MAKTVWKYDLVRSRDINVFKMPLGAEILSCKFQHDWLALWALVNPEEPLEIRQFATVGTGHSLPTLADDETLIFVDTELNGDLVLHVFEIRARVPVLVQKKEVCDD